ncbi:RRXRR domain-containing protein [Methanoculleus sp. UBA303]|uniref:RRXRR domain-containing protein n=1 Tax=Methanoculleus sp. UBA303 TaxID=1915497 RepID=UPI0025E6EF3F|nr:RRXRR domain-containing protein [Methanoculleus sp. UBA303]MDD3934601.1 RRXRR domain-containing protein [Methanoculleus sp.]
MRVPVMDTHRTPLMPTTPTRARLLLKQGKAKPYWNKLGIFCIILTYTVEPDNRSLVVGIDPGSSFEGWSVVGTKETVLNGMSEAPKHVKKAVEVRRTMRRARRHRKCWRRPARFNNRSRNKEALPPSTFARWNAKIRILEQLRKVLPITDVVVEDVAAGTKKNCTWWNTNFSPLEVGKQWFYRTIRDRGLDLHLHAGYETKELRERFGLKKTRQKSKQVFAAHAVDAWVMAADVSGAEHPTERGLYYWAPIRFFRRQLHRLQPEKGGNRKPYGGTRSLGFSRGTLVRHIKHGLTYLGGTLKGRVSLHSAVTGKRVTQNAKVEDCTILTRIAWRTQLYAGTGRRHSSPA